MFKLLPLVIVLAGCIGGTFDKVPGQDDAIKIVWDNLYGMSKYDPPPIEWFHQTRLDGDDFPLLWCDATDCWSGIALPGWKIQVAIDLELDNPMTESSFCHELVHYRSYVLRGDIDVLHKRENYSEWRDKCRTALLTRGWL